MRSLHRILATALASAAIAGLAVPAAADPSNGEGCAGVPSVPAAYVCVISVTPTNALPDTSTGGFPVTVPAICYVAGCTSPTTVSVPIPGAQPGDGDLAVIWYGGTYYPIGVGIGGSLTPLVQDALNLAGGVLGTVNATLEDVNRILEGLPPLSEIVDAVEREIGDATSAVDEYLSLVRQIRDEWPTIVAAVIELVLDRINDLQITCVPCP